MKSTPGGAYERMKRPGKVRSQASARIQAKKPRVRPSRRATDISLELLRSAIENLDELFLLCDAEDRIVLFNRRWDAMAPGEAAVGQRFEDFLRRRTARGQPLQALGREEEWIAERLAARRSGGLLELQFGDHWYQIRDRHVAGGATVSIGVEITERKRMEQALVESEARFRSLTELSSDWYWEQGADLRFVSTVGRNSARGGITADDHAGRMRWDLPGTEILGQTWAQHQAVLADRKPFRDLMLKRSVADGTNYYIAVSGEPFVDARGAFAGYRGIAKDVTAQRESDRRAHESVQQLSAAIEHLNESIAVVDAEDRIVVTNRRFRDLNNNTRLVEPGHRYEEHQRAGLRLGNYPEAAGREEAWLEERLARRRRGGTLEVKRQGGKWLQVTDQRLPDGGMITFALDITARKEAALALMHSEARFRDFAQASAEWFWETDAQGRYTWLSDSFETASGMKVTDRIGLNRIEQISAGADLGEEPWASHVATLARHAPFRDLRAPRRWPGGESWVSVSGVPRFSERGEFLGYRGSSTDITEQVQAAQRARSAEDRLRLALENLGELICLTDAEDRIVLSNRRFIEFNSQVAEFVAPGRRYDEHLRAGIALGLFPDAVGREEEWITERMAVRLEPSGPVERRRQDGRWLMVDDRRLPDGSTISFGIEITERKRAEAALRNVNTELERRVTERTAALQAAYGELESFSYSVSHDLRSPLGVIASFAGILAKQESERISEDGRRLVAVIDDNAQRMGRLIDALLELMRMSRRALVFRGLDMKKIARTACRELQNEYPRAKIEVRNLPASQGDETLIQQVYANLVGNALKFSSKTASPRIELGAETIDGAAVYFVRDNGAGFDTEHAAKLFKPFERLHSEQEFPGTGIGLALVQLIVRRHGGRIWAESAPGRGSTFRFTLAQEGSGTLAGGDSG